MRHASLCDRASAPESNQKPLRRFRPPPGQLLTYESIKGYWRATGAIEGSGFFSVVWETHRFIHWAPLHDFCHADLLRLIAECRSADRYAGLPGARPEAGRGN